MQTEKKRRQQSQRAKYYVPNGKAEEFIAMVGSGENFVNMFIAGNGVGKSASGANILTNIIFGKQNEYFNHPMFTNWPYEKKGRIISDPTTIKEKILPELAKWFPANESKNLPEANFDENKEGKNYVCKINTNTGWTIDIMSTEQATKEFESADLGFVWIDEPMPQDKFMATLARGRLGMIVVWTLTPLFFAAWIKDWKDENVTNGIADSVEAEMEDNCEIHGVRGILKHENIMRIANSFPEAEKQARVFGKFGHMIGRIHKKLNRKIHVIKPFRLNYRDYCVYKAIDTHPRVPDHVMYVAVGRNHQKYIVGELLGETTTKDLVQKMKAFETAMNYRIEGRLLEPGAFNTDHHADIQKDQKCVADQLYDEEGVTYIAASKDLKAGIDATDNALDYEIRNGLYVKKPELLIFETCPITFKQMDNYVWEEYKGAAKDSKKESARPRDKDDHMPENIHRLLLHDLAFVPFQYSYVGGHSNVDIEKEWSELDPYSS